MVGGHTHTQGHTHHNRCVAHHVFVFAFMHFACREVTVCPLSALQCSCCLSATSVSKNQIIKRPKLLGNFFVLHDFLSTALFPSLLFLVLLCQFLSDEVAAVIPTASRR